MAIEFECEECDRVLRVKDEHAGKRIKCPGCGARITIPEDEDFEDEFDDEDDELFGDDLDDLFEAPPKKPGKKRPPRSASSSSKPRPKRRRVVEEREPRRRTSERVDGELDAMDWILIVLCGGIACIIGIIACIRGDTERGMKMIAYPFIIGIIVRVVVFVIAMATQ